MKKALFGFSGLLVFLLLFSFGVRAYFQIKKSNFNFLSRSSFALIGEGESLLVLSFEGDSGFILSFPKDLRVQVTRGFGEYELGKVYPLGELEGKGSVLLKETLQETLSAPIFGFFQDASVKPTPQLISQVIFNALLGKSNTDLSKTDLLLLYLKSRKIDETKIEVLSFGTNLDEVFKDRKVREESLSFEVLNATEHAGFAQASAKLIDHCGGRVVRIADASQKQINCEFLVSAGKIDSYTIRWLKQIYPCEVKAIETDTARADISLVLGEEYWKKWSEKW
jgi:hypothetical protein